MPSLCFVPLRRLLRDDLFPLRGIVVLVVLAEWSGRLGGAPPQGSADPAKKIDTSPLVHECILKAPPAEVWKVWSSGEGFKALGVAKAEVDLRVGGLIRSHYKPEGVLGDDGTIQNEIIAFEPERMIAFRIQKPPKGFPFSQAFKSTWSVVTMTDLGDGRTHLRLAGLGYGADEESQAMRRFFETGNAWSLQRLQAHFDTSVPTRSGATAHAEPPLAPVDVDALVAAPREDVYRAYTTSEGWKAFFGADSQIEARPGGRFEIYFQPTAAAGQRGSEGCKVLSLLPGEMFSHTWNAPPKFPNARERPTWVVVEFEAVQAKLTRVRIRHLGFDEAAAADPPHAAELQETRKYFQSAWPKVLTALRDHFDKSTPK
ncbi:MAG TPA: SRPBCC domain-containing protein [Planctomycetota bacterium]|nr:SRPBCC domain-containing protein [Planctomycetota bacterium]